MSTPMPPSDAHGTGPADPYGDRARRQQDPVAGDGQGPGGLAVAALVVGIVAFLLGLAPFLGLLAGAAAVVLGVVVLRRSRDGSVGAGTRRTFGLVGIIGGGLAVLASLVTTVLFLVGLATLPSSTGATTLDDLDPIDPGQSQAGQAALDVPADVTPDRVVLTTTDDDPGVSIRLS